MVDFTSKYRVPIEQILETAKMQGQAQAQENPIIGGAQGALTGIQQGIKLSEDIGNFQRRRQRAAEIVEAMKSPTYAKYNESIPGYGATMAEDPAKAAGLQLEQQKIEDANAPRDIYVKRPDGTIYKSGDTTKTNVTSIPQKAEVISESPISGGVDISKATPAERGIARAIVEGRATPAQIASMRGNRREYYAQLVNEIDPNFDLTMFPERQKIRNDYTPNGTSGKALTSLNTVIGHLDTLQDRISKLNNKDIPKYNTIGNYVAKNVGKPEVDSFNAAKTFVDNELGKIAQGTGVVTDAERTEIRNSLNAASSPEQAKQVIGTWMDLIKSRTDAIKSNWNQTMGNFEPPIPIINNKSKKILAKYGYDPITMEKKESTTQMPGESVQSAGGYTVGGTVNGQKIKSIKVIKK